jgi:hypothetical protein
MITAELGYVSKDQLEQANKMFEKQIKDSFNEGANINSDTYGVDAEKYYNKKFKKK